MPEVVGYAAAAFVKTNGEQTMKQSQTPDADKAYLLQLARRAITSRLETGVVPQHPDAPSDFVTQNRGCFVTLNKNGQLRGCIGNIEPMQRLADCVADNAVNAAFRDPRFPQLTAAELKEVDIEISVLTVPKPLEYDGPRDLLTKLKPGVHGVILTNGRHRSTFLPQVWEQLENPEMFLIRLCQKAGLTANCWQDPDTKIDVYEAEHFAEHELNP
jgi:AmmeMemoRadiSam system protein A